MDVLLQHLLRDSAARAPDATCLRFAGGEQSYAELESESDQLARLLVRTKLRTGDRVGIYLPKSPRVVASMMATLKAGGVYVPIDPLAPPARAEMIARDAGVSHLFLNPERLSGWLEECALPESIRHLIVTGESLPALGASLPPMTRYDEYCGLPREPLPRAGRSEHDLAYILYTSGSTGRPKGVMLSHRNALAFVDWACTEFGLRATDRLSNHAPFHFDLTVFDLYAALRVGASCTIIDEVTARSARQLLGLIVDSELSVWYSVPSALRLLLDHSEFEADPPQSLRRILFAGEEFPLPQLRRLIRAIPAARYYN
jgi:non-ribosomal peptide synthetase component F